VSNADDMIDVYLDNVLLESDKDGLVARIAELERELIASKARERKAKELLRNWCVIDWQATKYAEQVAGVLNSGGIALDAYVEGRTAELREKLAAVKETLLEGYQRGVEEGVEDALGGKAAKHYQEALKAQARAEATAQAFDDAAERVCDAEVGIDASWDEDTYAAWLHYCQQLDNRIRREIEQARAEGAAEALCPFYIAGIRNEHARNRSECFYQVHKYASCGGDADNCTMSQYIYAEIEQAQAEEWERCCKAMCPHCADGEPIRLIDTRWVHSVDPLCDHWSWEYVEVCKAQVIREADDD